MSWLPTMLALAGLLFGCKTTVEQHPAQSGSARRDGYSLLHSLVSKQKDVSKLLIVKREQADVRELVQEIARVTGRILTLPPIRWWSKAHPNDHYAALRRARRDDESQSTSRTDPSV